MSRIWRALTGNRLAHREKKPARSVAIAGYESYRNTTKFVDALSDDDIVRLNALLPWHTFTVDARGRRFGNTAWEGKRDRPEIIPDKRVVLLDERSCLSGDHVLEIGCFEGIHTIALCQRAGKVTAIDARIENVVKTIVRCAMFGFYPTVFKCDVEDRTLRMDSLQCDMVFHVGVFYHLRNPVDHLSDLAKIARRGLLLDTHYALDDEATERYDTSGTSFRYKNYREGGYADPFSGVYDHAKWLRLDDITMVLAKVGFAKIAVLETRNERNGPRVLLMATKT